MLTFDKMSTLGLQQMGSDEAYFHSQSFPGDFNLNTQVEGKIQAGIKSIRLSLGFSVAHCK